MKPRIFFLTLFLLGLCQLTFAGVEVLGKMIYKYSAQKGESYTTVFKIRNTSDKDQNVSIYQNDYIFNYQGASFYNEPGTDKRSNARWIQFNPKTLLLRAREVRDVQFEVTVPISDSLAGTYWSLIMVEGVNGLDPNAKGQLNIHESIRTAIQIVTNIGNTGIGLLEFQKPGLVKEGEKVFFDFIMQNTGERLISPDVSMELFDVVTGESVKQLKAPKNGMYPTTSTKWRFPLEGLPVNKKYKAVIVADGSGDDVFGMEYTLEIK